MFGKCIFVMGQSKWLIATPQKTKKTKKKRKKEEEENQTLGNECTL
jgi:hypothetical protein